MTSHAFHGSHTCYQSDGSRRRTLRMCSERRPEYRCDLITALSCVLDVYKWTKNNKRVFYAANRNVISQYARCVPFGFGMFVMKTFPVVPKRPFNDIYIYIHVNVVEGHIPKGTIPGNNSFFMERIPIFFKGTYIIIIIIFPKKPVLN